MTALAGAAEKDVPLCDVCDEKPATKHCNDCKKNQFFCDGCYTHVHRSEKNKGHTSTSIDDFVAWSAEGAAAGAPGQATMCTLHTDEALKVFCDDCNILVCAMCGILQHNGHTLKPIAEAVQHHRGKVVAITAATKVSQQALADTVKSLYILERKIEVNRDDAIVAIEKEYVRMPTHHPTGIQCTFS